MVGGKGQNTFIVDNVDDWVYDSYAPYYITDPNPRDLVEASVSWTLGSNLEDLDLVGTAKIDGAGNELGNVITGNVKANILSGLAGNDTLTGKKGADVLIGGKGSDVLNGGVGKDTASYETSESGVKVDLSGRTEFSGDAVGDELLSIEKLIGTDYKDRLKGDSGNNVLSGLGGNDKLFGGGGNDRLIGDLGRDRLLGGSGNDVLDGAEGNDILIGGRGDDTFFFAKGDGLDIIRDFEIGSDIIRIGRGASDLSDLSFTQQGNDVLVEFRDVEITVQSVQVSDLNYADHFDF